MEIKGRKHFVDYGEVKEALHAKGWYLVASFSTETMGSSFIAYWHNGVDTLIIDVNISLQCEFYQKMSDLNVGFMLEAISD